MLVVAPIVEFIKRLGYLLRVLRGAIIIAAFTVICRQSNDDASMMLCAFICVSVLDHSGYGKPEGRVSNLRRVLVTQAGRSPGFSGYNFFTSDITRASRDIFVEL